MDKSCRRFITCVYDWELYHIPRRDRAIPPTGRSILARMSIVAGIDFGTLSVRVSIFDSEKGRLGAGSGDYPLHRSKDDPDLATQSHAAT